MENNQNSADDKRSRLFGSGRLFDLDSMDNWQEVDFSPFWPSAERPDDPKAYVVRQVLENHTHPRHREVLEGVFFEGRSISELAKQRRVTRRAVTAMLQRAMASFRKALLEHALEYAEVPDDER